MDANQPNYELFLHYESKIYSIIRELVPGVPVPFEEGNSKYLIRKAMAQGIIIRAKEVNGVTWICRIKDQDIPKITRNRK